MKKKIKEFSYDELIALFCSQHMRCKECPLHIENKICYIDYCKFRDKYSEIGEEETEIEQSISSDEALKVIELLNEKDIIIFYIKLCENLEKYNSLCDFLSCDKLTQQEYNLLRKYFK